jgi:hypothetical protein
LIKDLRAAGQWALQDPKRSAEFLSGVTKVPIQVLQVSEEPLKNLIE